MDLSVLHKLTYGMYAVGTLDGIRPAGCIVNTVIQVTSDNPVIAVSMNKNNFTYEAIKKSGRFSISILSEAVERNVIAELGFACGRKMDKFCGKNFACGVLDGLPIVKEHACGYMVCDVIAMHDAETHCVIMARLTKTLGGTDELPMTYEYYHNVIKGKAPKMLRLIRLKCRNQKSRLSCVIFVRYAVISMKVTLPKKRMIMSVLSVSSRKAVLKGCKV